jgi:hypothetical protein
MWENNIKMDLKEIGYEGVHFIYLSQSKDKCLAVMNMMNE